MVSQKTEAEIAAYVKEQEQRVAELMDKFDRYRESSEAWDALFEASKALVEASRHRRVRAFGAILRAGERKDSG